VSAAKSSSTSCVRMATLLPVFLAGVAAFSGQPPEGLQHVYVSW
jgi:hypothetical protein